MDIRILTCFAMLIEFCTNGYWGCSTQTHAGLSFLKPQPGVCHMASESYIIIGDMHMLSFYLI